MALKILHLADLHLGKNIYGISMIDSGDQGYWVDRLFEVVDEKKPDAVVISGDIYDRSSPSGEAYKLFNRLLAGFKRRNLPVMVVAGNHDSGLRLGYLSDFLEEDNIYIAGQAQKELKSVKLTDSETGEEVTFWLMPYVYPDLIANLFEDESIKSYNEAIKRLLDNQGIDFSKRNVLIAHQNVVDKNNQEIERSGSEASVGGVGRVSCDIFAGFEYVALGHIHSGYPVTGDNRIRYAGTPLCYHFDETKYPDKGCLMVELKGLEEDIVTDKVVIPALHKVRVVEGGLDSILESEAGAGSDEFIKVVITDRRLNPEVNKKIEALYSSKNSRVLEILSSYRTMAGKADATGVDLREKESVDSYFTQFYTQRNNGQGPSANDADFIAKLEETMVNNNLESTEDIDDALIEKLLDFVLKQEA